MQPRRRRWSAVRSEAYDVLVTSSLQIERQTGLFCLWLCRPLQMREQVLLASRLALLLSALRQRYHREPTATTLIWVHPTG